MNINLRRAHKLRKELEAHLNHYVVPVSTTVSLLVHENVTNPNNHIQDAQNELHKLMERFSRLSNVLASVRTQIATANANVGVESKLAEIGHIDRLIAMTRKIAVAEVMAPDAELTAELQLLRKQFENPPPNSYHTPARTAEINIVSQNRKDTATSLVNELKRSREALEDQRTGLNAQNNIVLSEEDSKLLEELGLL